MYGVLLLHMCRPLLLECSTREVREVFGKLLEKTMSSFFQMGGIAVCICYICIVYTFHPVLYRESSLCDYDEQCRAVFLSASLYVSKRGAY